jgi:hypothetical protein
LKLRLRVFGAGNVEREAAKRRTTEESEGGEGGRTERTHADIVLT